MQYIVGGLILIFIIKLAFDLFANYGKVGVKDNGKGRVIDISDKWINIDSLPYRRIDALFTSAELAFFHEIETLLADSVYCVLPKISMAEIISIPGNTHNRPEYLRRAREKNLDLVLFEMPDYTPRVVVILEEGTISKRQQLSDLFTEKALAAAGYAYMKVNINEIPDPQKVIHSLQKLGISV